ncbi:hypothetical protein Tco_1144851 [Tanacetum coccineum]
MLSIVNMGSMLGNIQQKGHLMERIGAHIFFINTKRWNRQEKNLMGFLIKDDGIVNWGEHTEMKRQLMHHGDQQPIKDLATLKLKGRIRNASEGRDNWGRDVEDHNKADQPELIVCASTVEDYEENMNQGLIPNSKKRRFEELNKRRASSTDIQKII